MRRLLTGALVAAALAAPMAVAQDDGLEIV